MPAKFSDRNNFYPTIVIHIEIKTHKFMENKLILKYSPKLRGKQLKRLLLTMKLTVILSLFAVINLTANVYSQNKKISIQVEDIQLRDLFREIENNSEYAFFFNDQYSQLESTVSLEIKNENIENILERVLENTLLDYKIMDNNFVVIIAKESLQGIKVQGLVTDAEGEPLPGVNVIEKGTTNGVVSDVDGNYSITVESGDAVLVFSFVGYLSEEIYVGDKTSINLTLIPAIEALEEVVVVGYGVQKKSLVSGSIAKVDRIELQKTSDLRIEQALQGRTAGVMIMNNSGQPGDNLTIRIRGVGTHHDPDPLFLVDGLPMEKESLDYLNPADVESVEILKDASSAAIYGTRGANGVILITTKQGQKGEKFRVTYDGYYCLQNPWRKLDMLNASEYIELFNEANENDGKSNPLFSQQAVDTMTWDTDWQDEMYYYNAPKQSHTISINGGGENSTYSSSLSYFSQDGIIAKGKSNFERITFRLNSTQEIGRLKFGGNLNFVDIRKKGIDANNQFGIGINQAINMPPIVPVKFDNGIFATPNDFNISIQEITNPIALLYYINRAERTNKVLGNIYADLEIVKGLVLRTNFGTEFAYVNQDEYVPVYFIDATHRNDSRDEASDYVTKEIHKYIRWNWDNTLNYTFSIQKHNISALIGMTSFKEWDERLFARNNNLIFDDFQHAYLDNALNAENVHPPRNDYQEHTLASYFGRLNYNYEEKYLFEAVLRIDGSSRFGSAQRYAKFPAFSGGWVISRENFFPRSDLLNFLKLRASWGQNGSENIPNFRYVGLMTDNVRYYFGDDKMMYNGIRPEFVSNAGLKWETSEQLDIGLDLAFLSNRFTFTVDYYNKETKDWLISAPAPVVLGNNPPYVNGGSVRNNGMEFELGYKNRLTEDLFINILLTASTNKSEVLDIPNEDKELMGGTGVHGQGDIIRMEVGSPMGYFYGYKTDGIFQTQEEIDAYVAPDSTLIQRVAKPGDFKFIDLDTAAPYGIFGSDRTNIGNPYPKFITGMSFTVEFKGFDLYMFWYSALGHQIYMANRRSDLKYSNFAAEALNRFHEGSPSYDFPRITVSDGNGTYKKPSDFYVKDADFVRLKKITLGYTLPEKITNILKISNLRVYISSENLLTFTKYPGMEVEVGGTPLGEGGTNPIGVDHGIYPHSLTILGGVQIGF
jgi:TonB-linked SusC/RagA family outer membrane protein